MLYQMNDNYFEMVSFPAAQWLGSTGVEKEAEEKKNVIKR